MLKQSSVRQPVSMTVLATSLLWSVSCVADVSGNLSYKNAPPAGVCELVLGQSTLRHVFNERPVDKWTDDYKNLVTIPRVLKDVDPS